MKDNGKELKLVNTQLKNKLTSLWGGLIKPINLPLESKLSENIDFNILTTDELIFLVDVLGKSSGSNMSGFSVALDNYDILYFIREQIYNLPGSPNLSRRMKPILRCYDSLFNQKYFPSDPKTNTEGTFALVNMYLIAEIEHYMKLNNRYTTSNGILKRKLPTKLIAKLVKNKKGIKSFPNKIGTTQINQIGKIITVFKYRNTSKFAQYLRNYDKNAKTYMKAYYKMLSPSEVNGRKIYPEYKHTPIQKIMNDSRNEIMHGEKSYLGGMIFFYLSLHAIMFLCDSNMYNEY